MLYIIAIHLMLIMAIVSIALPGDVDMNEYEETEDEYEIAYIIVYK